MPPAFSPGARTPVTRRLIAVDALRGVVMLLMLLDHVRETFYQHMPLSDPMTPATTSVGLFIIHALAYLCAPVFVLLTGLSAALYHQKTGSLRQTAGYLFTRGLFLMVLDITLVNAAWSFALPPREITLQVLWATGLSMVIMSVLLFLPRRVWLVLALIMIGGHNLLSHLHAAPGALWSLLHEGGWITLRDHLRIHITYPLLPWPGIMALGFCLGPWFTTLPRETRRKYLIRSGLVLVAVFFALRLVNGYGDAPWHSGANPGETLMGIFSLTTIPPSLALCSLTLGVAFLLLAAFDSDPQDPNLVYLACFGAAPLFFYLLHLYILKVLYAGAVMLWGHNQGDVYGVDHPGRIWMMTLILTLLLLKPVQTFANFKASRPGSRWLKYF